MRGVAQQVSFRDGSACLCTTADIQQWCTRSGPALSPSPISPHCRTPPPQSRAYPTPYPPSLTLPVPPFFPLQDLLPAYEAFYEEFAAAYFSVNPSKCVRVVQSLQLLHLVWGGVI